MRKRNTRVRKVILLLPPCSTCSAYLGAWVDCRTSFKHWEVAWQTIHIGNRWIDYRLCQKSLPMLRNFTAQSIKVILVITVAKSRTSTDPSFYNCADVGQSVMRILLWYNLRDFQISYVPIYWPLPLCNNRPPNKIPVLPWPFTLIYWPLPLCNHRPPN